MTDSPLSAIFDANRRAALQKRLVNNYRDFQRWGQENVPDPLGALVKPMVAPMVQQFRQDPMEALKGLIPNPVRDMPHFANEAYSNARAGKPMESIASLLQAGAPMGMMGNPGEVFHGSPTRGLSVLSSRPPARQFPNAASEFGVFFHVDREGANGATRYSDMNGAKGQVYSVPFPLKNPYEMTSHEFNRYLTLDKKQIEYAKYERRQLELEGYDGIIVRGRDGSIREIASFRDVPTGVQP